MRIPFIAGNWKMHKTIDEAVQFVNQIGDEVSKTDVEVAICAPFTLLKDLKVAAEGTKIKIAAQNMHFEEKGAFTGEISPLMLKELAIDYVIIGHSERRQYYNETDETVNKKLLKALQFDIMPIMCVGETLEQREAGEAQSVVEKQIRNGLASVSESDIARVVIAYEPIWAIGTGKTASAEDANEMIAFIRNIVKELYDDAKSEEVRIQYGGSVKPANVEQIMNQSDIDGALVGGASLKAEDFIQLVNF